MNVHYTLDERYLEWLEFEAFGGVSVYSNLAMDLHTTEFFHFIPNDDNRAAEGVRLRLEFLDTLDEYDVDDSWLRMGCSFLELIVAISRRASLLSEVSDKEWVTIMLDNLNLLQYTNSRYGRASSLDIYYALETINVRAYDYRGLGGLFPLKHPKEDQRGVEIWYQLSAYILENFD